MIAPTNQFDFENALKPWDGVWRVERPADFVPRLYRFHQVRAHDLLKRNPGLTEWDAHLLQVLYFKRQTLSPGQTYWLDRIEREAGNG